MPKNPVNRDGIYRRNGHFYISFVDGQGRRRQRKTSAATLQQARAIRAEHLQEAERQRVFGYTPPSEDTFAQFEERYLKHQRARITPAAYARSKGIVTTHLHAAFGTVRLAEIRRADVQRYITDRSAKVKPASVTKEFNVLKHMLELATQWEMVPTNNVRGIKPPKLPAGRVRYLQPTEMGALLGACPGWLRPIVLLLLATGMRRGELLALRWLDVDRKGGRILLPQTKNGDGRTVWLNALACRVIDQLPRAVDARPTDQIFPPVEPYDPHNVSVAFLRAARRAKIEDFRLHDLRHTCASWLRMRGADIHTVATQLGHRDLRMAARYQHLSPTYLQAAVQGLDAVFVPDLADGEYASAPALPYTRHDRRVGLAVLPEQSAQSGVRPHDVGQ